ncbi:type II secretion system protein GspM [Gallaecimonas kandeliae]|uniref:type II secretion system protein GspM n=1 Tax=Gallaecimonas kandeliae TaxID=3029055 RepID=UPI00264A474B|nr:type II secretion system protein GspM [Gallaecimonas kandeliae]WKE65665.1 type II secretion system protein GspM [Gallaecimonas kandeliae]
MNFSARQQQLLALAILVLALWGLWQWLLVPLLGLWQQYGDTEQTLVTRLDKYRQLATQEAQLQQQLAELQRTNPTADLYLPESKAALAAARLQQLISKAVESNGGQLISTQPRLDLAQPANSADPASVTVAVYLKADTAELVKLLYNLESSKPLLFLENLVIIANPNRIVGNPNLGARQSVPPLDVRFQVTGYLSKEQP